MKKFDVCRSEQFYYAWPTMVKRKDDSLFCVFTSCNHHLDRNNSQLMSVCSYDRGRTWTEPAPFTELTYSNCYFNNARVQRMGESIIVVCDKVNKNENSASPADVYLWISNDEAESFSPAIKTVGCGIVPDIRQLRNGDWLLTAHRKVTDTEKLVQYGWISTDRGASWSEEIPIGCDPRYNLCEASILECGDNTLIALMRENSFQGYDCFKSFSTDGGRSWSPVEHVPIPGCHRPTVGYLRDGSVLMTYRFLHGDKMLGENTFLALFQEEDAKEPNRRSQAVRLMPLDYDRHPQQQDCGYTDWVQFEDGEIVIVNYIKDDWDRGQIRCYSLFKEDILLSKG